MGTELPRYSTLKRSRFMGGEKALAHRRCLMKRFVSV